jgi:energy-coupling factor transport system substrate-specific component
MKELFKLWGNTRMIVLVALTASLYAAILIPFKVVIPIIPGITEFRPANVIPVICSLMFGPAASWGSAIGNLIGDFFGTLGLGSIFGFIGNFFYGFIPYKLWRLFTNSEPEINSLKQIFLYILISIIASLSCATIIGWWLDFLGLLPFFVLSYIIFINNSVVSIILGPVLLKILYPRVKKLGLLDIQILKKDDFSKNSISQIFGVFLLLSGTFGGFILGNLSINKIAVAPFIVLILISIFFM